jgi:hypothetical protein
LFTRLQIVGPLLRESAGDLPSGLIVTHRRHPPSTLSIEPFVNGSKKVGDAYHLIDLTNIYRGKRRILMQLNGTNR